MPPVKPSSAEEEYFARVEYNKLKKIHDEKEKHLAKKEKERRKELHFMHCPKCGTDLIEITLHKVQVDRCPDCEGIWLDHGELDTITKAKGPTLKSLLKIFD